MTDLGNPTLFPIAPDGNDPIRISRAWLTNIMATASGKEVRASLRTVPVRRLEYTAMFIDELESAQFRALWLTASERLRFSIPLWLDYATLTADQSGSIIEADTTYRDFEVGGHVLIRNSDSDYEIAAVDAVTDTTITIEGTLSGTYRAGTSQVVPVIIAWLEPPTLEQLTASSARVPLVFREELVGIAGATPAVGNAVTPTPTSIQVRVTEFGSPWGTLKFATLEAFLFDASGFQIPSVTVVWTIVPFGTGTLSPPTKVSYPKAGQQIRFEWEGAAPSQFHVTGTVGALTQTVDI